MPISSVRSETPPGEPVGWVDHGHTVLAIPVPELDVFVRERTAHYDVGYLAADPAFGQAHVTVLGPWVREPTSEDLVAMAGIVSAAPSFGFGLDAVDTFPNGIIHLPAEPAEPFRALTRAVLERFPDHAPYGGQFVDPVPHVTLDAVGPGVDASRVRELLGDRVPVDCRAREVQLQWWQAGRCHVQQSWQLAATPEGAA